MRQQVGEAGENFPSCGGAGQAPVETGVQHQIFFEVVIYCPQISYGIATQEWLGEVPDFSGYTELSR